MRKFALMILAMALIGSACSGLTSQRADNRSPRSGNGILEPGEIRLLSGLVRFDSCDDLLDHLKSEARDRVGPYGLEQGGYGGWMVMEDTVAMAEAGAVDAPQAGVNQGSQVPRSEDSDTSTDVVSTNVQESGVDEPDVVKTDGKRILVVSEGRLTAVDVADGEATDSLRLPEGWNHELFFQGDRALVFTNTGSWYYDGPVPMLAQPAEDTAPGITAEADEMTILPDPSFGGPAALITEIDLSDPDNLRIAGTLRIEGQYLSARSVGDVVRLALTTGPAQLPWVYPSGPGSEERAERFNREVIDESTLEDWIPEYDLTVGEESTVGGLLDCDSLHRPAEFSGFDVVSVLSFDLSDGLSPGDGVGVLAAGQTVYASTDTLYVATTEWVPVSLEVGPAVDRWHEDFSTDIHAFSIATDAPATYVASGSAPGTLLNQFSLDESDGYLRVITTKGSPWGPGEGSETLLSVLAEDDESLVVVGQIDGLGKGESLYSARILDNVAFAVTFRQIDPLYVLDLSDPESPEVKGELKIPGFSTYLHPIAGADPETGVDRVIGIGQDATNEGRTTGFKISLFDVSDPSHPLEVANWKAKSSDSAAQYDHRAFQMIGDIAVVPLQSWSSQFNGVVLFRIGSDSITEIGRISHEANAVSSDCKTIDGDGFGEENKPSTMTREGARCWPDRGNGWLQIQRSLAIGDTIWTMSSGQLQANNLDTLDVEAIVRLR
jgi:hypothetical protein